MLGHMFVWRNREDMSNFLVEKESTFSKAMLSGYSRQLNVHF